MFITDVSSKQSCKHFNGIPDTALLICVTAQLCNTKMDSRKVGKAQRSWSENSILPLPRNLQNLPQMHEHRTSLIPAYFTFQVWEQWFILYKQRRVWEVLHFLRRLLWKINSNSDIKSSLIIIIIINGNIITFREITKIVMGS